MRTKKITKMIQDAIADENRTGRLAETLKDFAQQRGVTPSNKDIETTVTFVREYVEHVPMYMQQASSAGQQMGLGAETTHMLQELEQYWFNANDLIPDHLGLVGITDDAYASLFLLQALSDYAEANFGRPLLKQNLTTANQGMRGLIGDPVVSILEQQVGVTLANNMMHRILGQLATGGFAFPSGPDPIWGNASIDEIVDTRLGAMGVI